MRRYMLPVLLGFVVIGLLCYRGARDADSPIRAVHASRALDSRRPEAPVTTNTIPDRQSAELERDLFRYADEDQIENRQVEPSGVGEPTSVSTPEKPVRLVGFIRIGRSVRAALVVEGVLEVLDVGREAAGYVLLKVDADAGIVRVRTPSGEEMNIESEPS